jgi:ATP/maltotriose-dependent transcriptional regulator MalT
VYKEKILTEGKDEIGKKYKITAMTMDLHTHNLNEKLR